MTLNLRKLSFVVSLLALPFVKSFGQANQCPGCNIDLSCTSTTNFPVLCPATLPGGTQMQPYDENVTFFMPDKVDASGFSNLDLTNVKVVSLTGMPLGLNWTTSAYPTNSFNPTSNVTTQRGCVKICGTPLVAGNYNVVVNVTVTVCDIPIVGCSTLNQSFALPITITSAGGGNSYFSFSPGSGCDTLASTFTPNFTTSDPVQMVKYHWNFGNGQTAVTSSTAPITQIYPTAGQYYPSLSTKLYNLRLTKLQASVTGCWWAGDIEEANCSNGNPDIYFIASGGVTHTSGDVGNNMNPQWTGINKLLTSPGITFQFMEEDNISQNDNGGATYVAVPTIGTYNGTTTAVSSGGGGVNFTITIDTALVSTFNAHDTIDVHTLPTVPTVYATPGFTACGNNNIVLHAPTGYNYSWYENDSTLIVNENDSILVLGIPANFPTTNTYRVVISDTITGCAVSSISYPVTYLEPLPIQFQTLGAVQTFSGNLTTNYNNLTYQWYLNGNPIVPTGQTQTYTPTANGVYTLVATNSNGCSETSNAITIYTVGLEENIHAGMFNLFPNPNTGEFTIQAENHTQKVMSISIVNMMGQTVYQANVSSTENTLIHPISLNDLAPGVYSAVVNYNVGRVAKQFIKK